MNQPPILVVDDETTICGLLHDVLAKHGYQVTCAASAADARRLVEAQPFALAILDCVLADGSGLELLVDFKRTHPQLPVMMLTGLGSDDELTQQALAKQATCCISKTAPLEELLLEIQRALGTTETSHRPA
jgi:two-component system response regulator HydG